MLINSENYLTMEYLWCYELPPMEEAASLFLFYPKVTHHKILIGYKSRLFSIFRNLMLITGGVPLKHSKVMSSLAG